MSTDFDTGTLEDLRDQWEARAGCATPGSTEQAHAAAKAADYRARLARRAQAQVKARLDELNAAQRDRQRRKGLLRLSAGGAAK